MLSWKPPANDGGNRITEYIVEKRDMKIRQWRSATDSKVTNTICEITKLVEKQVYDFRVFSVNCIGQSESAAEIYSITPTSKVKVVAPKFLESLPSNIVAKPDQDITLTAKISGTPKPVTKWYKVGY